MKKNELRKVLEEMPKMKLIKLFGEFSDGGEGSFWYANIFKNFEEWYELFDAPREAVESIKESFEESIGDMESPVRYSMGELEVVDIDDVYSNCCDNVEELIEFMWERRFFKGVEKIIEYYGLSEHFRSFKTKGEIKDDVNTFIRSVDEFGLYNSWYGREQLMSYFEKDLLLAMSENEYGEILRKYESDLMRRVQN